MKPLRVGIDGRELQAGIRTGIGRYVREVLGASRRAGWDCIIYGDEQTVLPEEVVDLPLRRLRSHVSQWWDQISLPQSLERDDISAFLSPYFKGPLWTSCPTVITIHDLFFINYPGRHRPLYDWTMTRLARLYAKRAQAIIADSEYSKQAIVTLLGIESSKITVIPLALGSEFRPIGASSSLNQKYGLCPPYILTIGNFLPHKNLPRLIEAYANLPSVLQRRYQLVLAGRLNEHTSVLMRMIEMLGISAHVHFPGYISDEDLPALYTGASLFVFPSLEEGFGLPALEALACGTPVAASNRASIPEVVGGAAVLFDPDDMEGMTQSIKRLLMDESLRERLRRDGFTQAKQFDSSKTTGQVIRLVEQIAGKAA